MFFALAFIAPAATAAGWWAVQDRPGSWRQADWSSSGILPDPERDMEAAVYVLSARTGGMKGALSVHSWIVFKRASAARYERYDKVGWGRPLRRNAYAADARWYSNRPWIVAEIRGARAERLIPAVEAAIASYPWSRHGGYHIWPGPNSNTFVAHVLRAVPELEAVLPPVAVGRDYRPGLFAFDHARDWSDIQVSLGGYLGVAAGLRSGLELQVLGLVAGIDIAHPALKLPGFGRIALWPAE